MGVVNNTLECTTWARDEEPSLAGVPKQRTQARKVNGLARIHPGKGGRPAEYLASAGGVSHWVAEVRDPGAAPGFDDALKPGVDRTTQSGLYREAW